MVSSNILSGDHWSGREVTYSMPSSASEYGSTYGAGEARGFAPVTPAQAEAIRRALDAWASLIDVEFKEVSTGGEIRFSQSSLVPTAWAYRPGSTEESGDVWLGSARGYFSGGSYHGQFAPGSYALMTITHEIGHALGLTHPTTSYHDELQYSIMSYHSYAGSPDGSYVNAEGTYPSTPMIEDVLALQSVYGASRRHAGDDVYKLDPSSGVVLRTLWDSGGHDTLDLSAYSTPITIDLSRPGWIDLGTQRASLGGGRSADGNVYVVDGTHLEVVVTGSGDDVIRTDPSVSSRVDPGSGHDRVVAGPGWDTLVVSGDWTATRSGSETTITHGGGQVVASGVELVTDGSRTWWMVGEDPTAPELAREVALLYRAGLGRDVDAGGYAHWRDSGATVEDVAAAICSSPEYSSRFGGDDLSLIHI